MSRMKELPPEVEDLLAYIGRITKNDLAATPLMCKEELDAHVRAIRAAQKER